LLANRGEAAGVEDGASGDRQGWPKTIAAASERIADKTRGSPTTPLGTRQHARGKSPNSPVATEPMMGGQRENRSDKVGTIQFSMKDDELLYSFPKPSADINMIVWNFIFINRTYPPSYDEFMSFLTKGLMAGIVRYDGERFVIDESWYSRIHKADAAAENEIESMLEFEEWFVGMDFDTVTPQTSTISEEQYHSIIKEIC
jgi:hypothetical protein